MKLKHIFKAFFFIFLTGIIGSIFINIWMVLSARNYIYTDINSTPPRTAVLVLGSMTYGTTLSHVLHDRVIGGIQLIENNKGKKLLLSGDHGQIRYDEVNAMRLFVLDKSPDIPQENIFMDHAGFNTWDSMYRARDVFEVKDIIIVTQEFHIARAVCIARNLGLDAVGYAVNQNRFSKATIRYWGFREYMARVKAFLSIVTKPKPRYLGDKIPITGDGRLTWD
ncbi:MAG: YdcF family protein [Treponema sp.]|nr:YdcF family protein [Treponema sp.]